jgi:hypothetical protein
MPVLPGQPLRQRLPFRWVNPILNLRLTHGFIYSTVQGIPQGILPLVQVDQDFTCVFVVDLHDGDSALLLLQGDKGIFAGGIRSQLAGGPMVRSQPNDPLRGVSLSVSLMPWLALLSSYARSPVLW